MLPLLKADPHHWGTGQVHEIDPDTDRTLCGQTPARCPGKKFAGLLGEVTCKACLKSRQSKIDAKARRAQHERERAQWEQEREEHHRQWWVYYNAYLDSPEWRRRRKLVMKRSQGMCEACGQKPAEMVHHRRYPQDCWPGSADWLRREKLFDLAAICADCHDDVHGL